MCSLCSWCVWFEYETCGVHQQWVSTLMFSNFEKKIWRNGGHFRNLESSQSHRPVVLKETVYESALCALNSHTHNRWNSPSLSTPRRAGQSAWSSWAQELFASPWSQTPPPSRTASRFAAVWPAICRSTWAAEGKPSNEGTPGEERLQHLFKNMKSKWV